MVSFTNQIGDTSAVFFFLVVSLTFIAGPSSATSTINKRASPNTAKQWVDKFCSELTKTKRISFVKELISNLELLQSGERPEQAWPLFFRSIIHSSRQPCIENSEAILELKPIIKEQHNVCSKEHLDLIDDYYRKHIKSSPTSLINSMVNAKTITEHFFMLYAKQVSHKCKKSMLRTLGQIESANIVTSADYEKALPWIRDASVMDACAVNNPFDGERITRERPAQNKSKYSCKALSVINGIESIGQLAVLLKSPDAVLIMNKLGEVGKTDSDSSLEESSRARDDRSGLIIVVPPNRMQMIVDLTMACLKFKPIYDNTVLPVVRLAQMGASPEFKDFDKACIKKPLMRKWFGLTLVCETILKSRLAENNEKYKEFLGDNHGENDIFVVYDECDNKQADCSVLEERFASQKEPKVNPLRQITNNLDDELWIHKYKTTGLQRLMESMKLFSVDDVQSHIVFVQKTANVKRWIGRGVITALLTTAINSA